MSPGECPPSHTHACAAAGTACIPACLTLASTWHQCHLRVLPLPSREFLSLRARCSFHQVSLVMCGRGCHWIDHCGMTDRLTRKVPAL